MRYLSGNEEKKAVEYMNKAAKIALDSTCKRARCGSVIVKDNEIIGCGFNSPPQDLDTQRRCQCQKDLYNEKVTDKTCYIHAEQRAIIDALRKNPGKIYGSRLYFMRIDDDNNIARAGKPYCTICSKMALDTGISEFLLWDNFGICAYDTEEYNTISYNYKE